MVNLILGLKGSGKTKQLVELIVRAVDEEVGNVVCIEKDKNLIFDIPYACRLIHATDYDFGNYEFFKGFISGLYAGNYDITHIFIDNFLRMFDDVDFGEVAALLDWLSVFGENNNVKFTISATAHPSEVGDDIKKYMIPLEQSQTA